MAAILYIETNALIGIAKGQEECLELGNPIESLGSKIQLVLPSICFVESLPALNQIRTFQNHLGRRLAEQKSDAHRDIEPIAKVLATFVEQVEISADALDDDATDNLILHCILSHAQSNPGTSKKLFSGDSAWFGSSEVKDLLAGAGVGYVRYAHQVLAWTTSLPDQGDP